MSDFKILDHPADIGIEIKGKTLEELFTNGVLGTTFLIIEPESVSTNVTKEINLQANNIEKLFIDFLDEIIYLFDSEGLLIKNIKKLEILDTSLMQAILEGEKLNKDKHRIKLYLKAVTYHQLEIKKLENGNWKAKVFFDV